MAESVDILMDISNITFNSDDFIDDDDDDDEPKVPKVNAPETSEIKLVFPIMAKQLFKNTIETFTVFNYPARIVCLCGIVRKITKDSNKITYVFEDETDTITAVFWLEPGVSYVNDNIKINKYVEIIGHPRQSPDIGRYLFIKKIQEIKKMAIIFAHLLEITCMAFYSNSDCESTLINKYGTVDNSVINGQDMDLKYDGHNSIIFGIIHNSANDGISRSNLVLKTPKSFTEQEIDEAIEYLTSNGLVYTTLNDYHYQSTC